VSVHPRVAVSGLSFPTVPATEAIESLAALGVRHTSIQARKVREVGVETVKETCSRLGITVDTTTGALDLGLSLEGPSQEGLARAWADIDLAASLGATSVYGLLGPRISPDWQLSVGTYVNAVGELVEHAADLDVTLAIEPASWLYADLTFVHTFHDAVGIARRAGMGICLDLFHTWMEGELREDITANVDLISHVQLSGTDLSTRSLPARDVPRNGEAMLTAVVDWLLDAGYKGVFDFELSGPRIDEIGHREAVSRAVTWLDALLVNRGA
jgi:sugar phosphate isomerase/epimerase